MKIYDEKTWAEIQNPDLSAGYTYPGRIKTGTRDVVMEGSVEAYPPNGLRHREDVFEDCLYYHEYTEDELAAQHPPDEPQPSDMEERLKAVEDELQAAKILLGVE